MGRIAEKPVKDMSPTERWAVFFRYCEDREKRELVNEILAQEEGIAMAGETLVTITKEEAEQWRETSRLKYEWDMRSAQSEAWDEGLEEGRVKGRVEGRAEGEFETARKMKADGFSPEQIGRYTGLSPEDIAGLC
jgi:predicted transposase/invertase (TIGR01784 family)